MNHALGNAMTGNILHIWLFAFGEKPTDPIPSHDIPEFTKYYKKAHALRGSRLKKLVIPENGHIDWKRNGLFKIFSATADDAKTVFIEHISGVRVPCLVC